MDGARVRCNVGVTYDSVCHESCQGDFREHVFDATSYLVDVANADAGSVKAGAWVVLLPVCIVNAQNE